MGLLDNDPDMWAVEARFGSKNKEKPGPHGEPRDNSMKDPWYDYNKVVKQQRGAKGPDYGSSEHMRTYKEID